MIPAAFTILCLIGLGTAQSSSTVSLFIPIADPQSLVGSIAGSDATATTYVVGCPQAMAVTTAAAPSAAATGLDDSQNECGFDSSFTIAQGPSTVHFALTVEDNTASINCQLMGSTQAVCTNSATGAALLTNSEPPLATATFSASDVTYLPVVITAGSATAEQTGSKSASPSVTAKTTASTATSSTGSTQTTGSTRAGTSGTSTSIASAQGTNAAMQASPAYGAGLVGALGVAVAGAML